MQGGWNNLKRIVTISYQTLIKFSGSQGTLGFEKTTLANIDPKQSPYNHYMWAHVWVGFLLFPISILIMKRFSVKLEFSEYDMNKNNTIMITKIPRKACHKNEDIMNYFKVRKPILKYNMITHIFDLLFTLHTIKSKSMHNFYCRRLFRIMKL